VATAWSGKYTKNARETMGVSGPGIASVMVQRPRGLESARVKKKAVSARLKPYPDTKQHQGEFFFRLQNRAAFAKPPAASGSGVPYLRGVRKRLVAQADRGYGVS